MGLSDVSAGGFNVASSWRKEQKPVQAGTQTPSFETVEKDVQTFISLFYKQETHDEEVQTSEKPPGVAEPVPDTAEGLEGFSTFEGMASDEQMQRLAKFLDSAMPSVRSMLQANVHSFAFEGYDVLWDRERTTLEAIHTLAAPMYENADLQVTSVAWNSTGSVVAAAYGRVDLVGWCRGSGYICTWNVSKRDLTKPDAKIEVPSYVNNISFHPTSPSLLLGGCYTGEVMLWDVSAETPLLAASNLQSDLSHREPVCRVLWLLDRGARATDINQFVACTASGDGRLLFWNQNAKEKERSFDEPVAGYVVQPAVAAGGARTYARADDLAGMKNEKAFQDSRDEVCNRVGVLSLNVANSGAGTVGKRQVPATDSRFVLGTEGGGVYRASVDLPKVRQTKWAFRSLKIGSEAISLEPHYGPVQAASMSPFERNLFVTVSSDGSAKLRNLLEGTLLTLEPGHSAEDYIYCVEFSPARPCVLAMGMRSSTLVIYDLEESTVRPMTVDAGDGQAVLALAFNPVNRTLLATGDGKGQLKIWQLPNSLTQLSKAEQQLLAIGVADTKKRRAAWHRMTGMSF